MYGLKGRARSDRNQSVGATIISNSVPVQQHQEGNQHRSEAPMRQCDTVGELT